MSSSRPSTSFLLQLFDALEQCVPAEHHTQIIGDALREAGLIDLPVDVGAFRDFVSGPLTAITTEVAGEVAATELSWMLRRQTSVRAPSSGVSGSGGPPRSTGPRHGRTPLPTAEYTEDLFLRRADVLVVDPSDALIDELRIHLEAREYRVSHEDKPVTFSRDAPPRLLLTNMPADEALQWTAAMTQGLGDRTPRVIILCAPDVLSEVPSHVDRVMAPDSLAAIVAAIVELLGEPV